MKPTRRLPSVTYILCTCIQWFSLLGLTLGCFAAQLSTAPHAPPARPPQSVPAKVESQAASPKLPPLPPGVAELKFSEFFVHPAGPRGLELTAKLRELHGQRVRILGYMVRQEASPPGNFLLTPLPLEMHEHDDHCFIDDLPASRVQVFSPAHAGRRVSHTPGLLLLTGTLNVGNRAEEDGRVSVVRLELDAPAPTPKRRPVAAGKGAERLLRPAQLPHKAAL